MIKKIILLLTLAFSATALGLAYARKGEEDLGDKVREINAFLSTCQQLNKFNGAVLLARDGEVLLKKGYGIRNAEADTVHDAESIFRIYSITKSITSTVVLQLIEQGKLSLTDSIAKFYPDLPQADEITIEHLLSHTSGLYEFTREGAFENSEASLLELLAANPPDFPPGQSWSYCNSGYCMLGHIISKVSGASYEQTVAKHIFEPVGMKNSGFNFASLNSPKKAIGYRVFTSDEKLPAVMESSGGPFAAGAIYSTVEDMHAFQQALLSGDLLSPDSLEIAWAGCSQNDQYGLGWQLGSRWFRRKVISHSGGAAGFRSNMTFMPTSGVIIVVFNNHEHANVSFLSEGIYDILDGKEVVIPEEKLLSKSELVKLVGFYHVSDPRSMMIRTMIMDGRLAVERDGQLEGTLIAQEGDRFYHPESGMVVTFVKDADGNCVGLNATQGWRTMKAIRNLGPWGIPDTTEAELTATLSKHSRDTKEWHEAAFHLAPLLVYSDKHAEYRKLCREMLDSWGDTKLPQMSERTVKTCLITPPNPEMLAEVSSLADRAFSNSDSAGTFEWGGPVPWRSYLALAKGTADYRRAGFESAIAVLKSADAFSRHDAHSPCVRDLFLAMAYAKSGQLIAARQILEAADEAIRQLPSSYMNSSWNDRIVIAICRKEAQELFQRFPVE